MPRPARTESRGDRRVLAWLLGIAIVVNVVQFPVIESRLTTTWEALHRYPTASLTEIGLRHGDAANVRERFGLALALSEVAPGATVAVPDWWHLQDGLDPALLYGLGRVAAIQRRAYDPDTLHMDIDLDAHVVASGPGGEFGEPYAIALGDDGSSDLLLLRRDHLTLVLVDTRLLPPDGGTTG